MLVGGLPGPQNVRVNLFQFLSVTIPTIAVKGYQQEGLEDLLLVVLVVILGVALDLCLVGILQVLELLPGVLGSSFRSTRRLGSSLGSLLLLRSLGRRSDVGLDGLDLLVGQVVASVGVVREAVHGTENAAETNRSDVEHGRDVLGGLPDPLRSCLLGLLRSRLRRSLSRLLDVVELLDLIIRCDCGRCSSSTLRHF